MTPHGRFDGMSSGLVWPAHIAAGHVREHEAVWFIRYHVTGYNDGKPFFVGPYTRDAAELHAADVAGYSGVYGCEVIDGLVEHEATS